MENTNVPPSHQLTGTFQLLVYQSQAFSNSVRLSYISLITRMNHSTFLCRQVHLLLSSLVNSLIQAQCLLCQISNTNPLAHFLFEALYFFAVSICQLAASLFHMELLSLMVTNTYILSKMSINRSYLVSLEVRT